MIEPTWASVSPRLSSQEIRFMSDNFYLQALSSGVAHSALKAASYPHLNPDMNVRAKKVWFIS